MIDFRTGITLAVLVNISSSQLSLSNHTKNTAEVTTEVIESFEVGLILSLCGIASMRYIIYYVIYRTFMEMKIYRTPSA